MNEAEDQVLEHALRELLWENTSDLPERVLRAWRGSQRVEARGEAAALERPTRYRWLAAAVALVLVLLWIEGDRLRGPAPSDPAVIATSEGTLDVFREGDPNTHPQSSFRPGETLVNGPLRERQITLSSGESITLGRCSMLTLDHDGSGLVIAPLLGQVTLQTGARSQVRVLTSLGTLAPGDPGRLQIELLAEGYGLEQPESFQQLAKELHMKSSLPLILTLLTVLEGTALLETTTGTRPLVAGDKLQDHEDEVPSQVIKSKLLDAVGTWDLTVTEPGRNGGPGRTFQGEEVCRAGPGGEWLITDMTLATGQQQVEIHTVVGFDARKRSYTGTLFDSFGGEMGLLRGTVGTDLESRTLRMFSAQSTPGFDVRWQMRWEGPDERRTRIEALLDEEWVLLREVVHRRRE